MPTPDHPLLDAVRGALEDSTCLLERVADESDMNEYGMVTDQIANNRKTLRELERADVEVWWLFSPDPDRRPEHDTLMRREPETLEWEHRERVVILRGGKA